MAPLTHTQEMTAPVIRHTAKLYSYQLPGATLLVPALLMGCEHILQEGGANMPHFEALVLASSILHHADSKEQRVREGTHRGGRGRQLGALT